VQRRANRNKKQEQKNLNQHILQNSYHIKQRCLRNFGFIANPKNTIQKNFNDIIQLKPTHLSPQPSNLAYHNLCTHSKIPPGTRELLGLNLKYCLASSQLNNDINPTIQKMAYAIRTQYNLQTIDKPNNSDYIKQIYIKNKSWNPEPAPLDIEDKITHFEKQLKNQQKTLVSTTQGRNFRNLTYPQSVTLRRLKLDGNLTIKNTDKNLSPAIMETEDYVTQVLKDHLLTKDYEKLSEVTAKYRMDDLTRTLKMLITENYKILSKPEITYFQRSFKQQYRTPIFYGLPKIHKTPVTLRPVVSSSSSFLSIFSVWLDF
jgi:hypothetical protein